MGDQEAPETPTTITVQLGTWARTYVVVQTTAPARADGFGTMTVLDGDDVPEPGMRWVLVDVEHMTWQTQRYGSAMYSSKILTDPYEIRLVEDALVQRFHDPSA